MLFDARTREHLRDAGLTRDDLRRIEDAVAADARETADAVESFFDAHDVVYSDMDLTHAKHDRPEHDVDYCDLFTHSQDIRGFLRFETWGVYVEGTRVLREAEDADRASGRASDTRAARREAEDGNDADATDAPPVLVELSLGATVHDRVRFAASREAL